MPALLLSHITRWLAIGAVLAALAGWGAIERAGRQAARADAAFARAQVANLEARIRNMEARNAVDDAVRRERDPTDRLREEWSRD
jgi:hypothetical protein